MEEVAMLLTDIQKRLAEISIPVLERMKEIEHEEARKRNPKKSKK
jgi:hypothetical protein